MTIVFDNEQLLPAEWRSSAGGSALRMFNPALLPYGNGWLMAYRVVAAPGLQRRIALCRLDADFRVVAGFVTPLSDSISFATPSSVAPQALTWFADPRLYRLQGRLFIYWNSGWHEPQNHQFLQELEPRTLRPVGAPRELQLAARQKLEKNWALFEAAGQLYAVYSVNPHRVLRFALDGEGPITFTDAAPAVPNPGGFAQVHGGLRGGAPPQQLGDHFYSVCHSIENAATGYEYVPAVYRFSATAPFQPTDMPRVPLSIELPPRARRALPKLNPAIGDILYPAGAAYQDGHWVLSLGVDDERCAIAVLDHADLIATLERR